MNITKESFIRYCELYEFVSKREHDLYKNGFDIINFVDNYHVINSLLLSCVLNKEQKSMLEDFLNESWNGMLYDKDGEIIQQINSYSSLYDYFKSHECL